VDKCVGLSGKSVQQKRKYRNARFGVTGNSGIISTGYDIRGPASELGAAAEVSGARPAVCLFDVHFSFKDTGIRDCPPPCPHQGPVRPVVAIQPDFSQQSGGACRAGQKGKPGDAAQETPSRPRPVPWLSARFILTIHGECISVTHRETGCRRPCGAPGQSTFRIGRVSHDRGPGHHARQPRERAGQGGGADQGKPGRDPLRLGGRHQGAR